MKQKNYYDYNEDNYTFENDYENADYIENDLKRDTYYALTNGEFGDYDDFMENGGDMDFLRECIGL